jgi:hypothetical protein
MIIFQVVMNTNGDYLNRLIDSSDNYWKGGSVTLKDRHRPPTSYKISGVVKKNKFLLTKAVS